MISFNKQSLSVSLFDKNNEKAIIFHESGAIELLTTEDIAFDLMFRSFFQSSFMNESCEDKNNNVTIYNSIKINSYEGTIKYVGSYHAYTPDWIQRIEDRLQKIKNLKAFL